MYAPQDRADENPGQDREPGRDVAGQDHGTRPKASVATRKKFPAKTLLPGQSIFHDYKWEPPKTKDGEGAKIARGRKPYEWTPERSRQLIKLIIHTDLPFDDVTKIMRDTDGEGPSESTCRNHWHDIFGYRPDEARLKNPEGRDRRRSKLLQAFHRDTGTASPSDGNGTEPDLVHDGSIDADSSPAASSNSSMQYSNSMIDGDNIVAISQADDDMNYNLFYNPSLTLTPPKEQDFRNVQYGFPSTSNAKLPSVVEEGPTFTPGTRNEHTSPANTSTPTPDSTVAQIEQKEDLPPGFINWFRRTSIGSSFFTEGRHQSVASMATSRRRSYQPNRGSVATISQPLSSNAILNILENSDSTTTIQAGHIEKLIDRGADINARNAHGETPLHLAMRLGNIVVFSALLARGANPNARTKTGESIWTYGRNASKRTLDPNKQYVDKDQQRLDTMICAHIEFLKATSQFNRDLVTESKSKKSAGKHNSSSSAVDPKRRRSSGATSASSTAPPVLPWSMTPYGMGSSTKRQKKPRSVDSNSTEQTQGRMSSLGESVQWSETDSRPSMHKANSSPSPYTTADMSQHLSTSAPSSDGRKLSWGMSWLSKKSQNGGVSNPYMSNISTQMPAIQQQDTYKLDSASPHTSFVSTGFDAQQMPTSEAQFQDWHFPDPSALHPQSYYGETKDLVAFPDSITGTDPANIPYDYSGDITPTQSFILDPSAQAGAQAAAIYGATTSHPTSGFTDVTYDQMSYAQPMLSTTAATSQPQMNFATTDFEQTGFSMEQTSSWEAKYRALEQQMEQQRQQNELLRKQLAHQSAWLDSTMYNWDAPAGPAT